MRSSVRRRFWWESALAGLTGALAVLTAVWHEWIEALGIDPDHGDGSAEWLVVAILVVVCLVSGVLARVEWPAAACLRPSRAAPQETHRPRPAPELGDAPPRGARRPRRPCADHLGPVSII